jgi:predicted cupin superfamily sugar epimerase
MIDRLIEKHRLEPHPEGGFYRRLFEHAEARDGWPLASAILYLLPEGVQSRWHRIDAVELWHAGDGAPLELSTSPDGTAPERRVLGGDGARLLDVPTWVWQSARSLGEWSLVTVTVVPAFVFDGFELALDGWEPDT